MVTIYSPFVILSPIVCSGFMRGAFAYIRGGCSPLFYFPFFPAFTSGSDVAWFWPEVGAVCPFVKLTLYNVTTRTRRGPGFLVVRYSRLARHIINTCNRARNYALPVSRMTSEKIVFSGTCMNYPLDRPSHTTL